MRMKVCKIAWIFSMTLMITLLNNEKWKFVLQNKRPLEVLNQRVPTLSKLEVCAAWKWRANCARRRIGVLMARDWRVGHFWRQKVSKCARRARRSRADFAPIDTKNDHCRLANRRNVLRCKMPTYIILAETFPLRARMWSRTAES